VKLPKARQDLVRAIACGLNDELSLAILFHDTLPPIKRGHRRLNVHAGGEPFVDQRAGDAVCALVGGLRRQNQNEIAHI